MPQLTHTRTPLCGETSIAAVAVTHLNHPPRLAFLSQPNDRQPNPWQIDK